jgi:hypothetical protein
VPKRTRNQTLDRAGGRAGRMVCQGDTLMKDQKSILSPSVSTIQEPAIFHKHPSACFRLVLVVSALRRYYVVTDLAIGGARKARGGRREGHSQWPSPTSQSGL